MTLIYVPTFDVQVMVNGEGILFLCLKYVNRYFTLWHPFGKGLVGKELEIRLMPIFCYSSAMSMVMTF